MSRFTYDEYMAAVDAGRLGAPNLIETVLDEEDKNEVLKAALDEANTRLVMLEGTVATYVLLTETPYEEVRDSAYARYTALIKWLALPWADNDPYWPTHDGWTRQALDDNATLHATWMEVVRGHTQSGEQSQEQEDPGQHLPEIH
jgi:non-ribosomal peptide synthetase component F